MRNALLLAFAGCGAAQVTAPRPTTNPTWDALVEALPGAWSATTPDGTVIPVTFTLIANGTVVLETFGPADHQTATTYSRAAAGVEVTHYCGQGNQAHLRATTDLDFTFVDARDVDPGEGVLIALVFAVDGPDAFTRTETYRIPPGDGGGLDVTPYVYRRVPASP